MDDSSARSAGASERVAREGGRGSGGDPGARSTRWLLVATFLLVAVIVGLVAFAADRSGPETTPQRPAATPTTTG